MCKPLESLMFAFFSHASYREKVFPDKHSMKISEKILVLANNLNIFPILSSHFMWQNFVWFIRFSDQNCVVLSNIFKKPTKS